MDFLEYLQNGLTGPFGPGAFMRQRVFIKPVLFFIYLVIFLYIIMHF